MVVHLMNEDKLIDLDELQLFGMFRECDPETARSKWKEENDVSIRNEATGLLDRLPADGQAD